MSCRSSRPVEPAAPVRPPLWAVPEWRAPGAAHSSPHRPPPSSASCGLRRRTRRAAAAVASSIELPATDAVLAGYHRRRHPRLHALGHDLALLLRCPTTALSAGAQLGAQAPSARMIRRTSIIRLRSTLCHAVLCHHRQYLALNRPRRAT